MKLDNTHSALVKITVSVSRCMSTNESESWCPVSPCGPEKEDSVLGLCACVLVNMWYTSILSFCRSLQYCLSDLFLCLPDKTLSLHLFFLSQTFVFWFLVQVHVCTRNLHHINRVTLTHLITSFHINVSGQTHTNTHTH